MSGTSSSMGRSAIAAPMLDWNALPAQAIAPIVPPIVPPWPCEGNAWTFLAPMEGVTHPAFRALIARRPGVGVVCTEFVRIAAVPVGDRYLRKQVVRAPGAALSVQVMGNDKRHLAEATGIVASAGADIVDLNVGCPAPRAVRKGVGAALLKEPKLLGEVVTAMRAQTQGCLSAKMRAGYDDAGGAVEVARIIEGSGADLIAVHPRRRVDYYQGVADWRIIAAIKKAVSIPVIGNGDVWYAADAQRMKDQTGCDGVMIGRGAMRNPWIFSQIESLRRGEKPVVPSGEDLLRHFDDLVELLNISYPKGILGMLKEQTRYFGRAMPNGTDFMRSALRAQTIQALRDVLERRVSQLGPAGLDLKAHGGTYERSGGAT